MQKRPKHVGKNFVNKIYHKHWSAFCWLFIYYISDYYTDDGAC